MKSKYITHEVIKDKVVTTPGRKYRTDQYRTRKRGGFKVTNHVTFDTSTEPPTMVSHWAGGAVFKLRPELQPQFMFYNDELWERTEGHSYRRNNLFT